MAGHFATGVAAAPYETVPASQTGNDDNDSLDPHDGYPGNFDDQSPPKSPPQGFCTARDPLLEEIWENEGVHGTTDPYHFLPTYENGLREIITKLLLRWSSVSTEPEHHR